MKIRTGFVTNSSGSSFTEINIENTVLVDILKKYEELFYKKANYKCDIRKLEDGKIKAVSAWGDQPPVDAFWDFHDNDGDIASSVSKKYLSCLKESIKYINDNEYTMTLFDELESELDKKKDLINKSFKSINSDDDYSGDLGGCASYRTKMLCDFRNKCPNCNQPLIYYERTGWEDEPSANDDWESHEINEKLFYCSNLNCDYEVVISGKEKKFNLNSRNIPNEIVTYNVEDSIKTNKNKQDESEVFDPSLDPFADFGSDGNDDEIPF